MEGQQKVNRDRGGADPGEAVQGPLAAVQLQVGHVVKEIKLRVLVQQVRHVSILVRELHKQAPQQRHMLLHTTYRSSHASSVVHLV